ncbi:MAG TPA: hypothetical protein VNG29_03995, partial [Candidatus Paceibacterota bacterium]|nr:hypothetical protein [Candidatus Paceibacterota bacterium]
MQQLFSQLGIDWHLLLSQAVNFFLLLVVLRLFIYKPLLKLMRERREKIEQGVVKAGEAEKRLLEADELRKEKVKLGEAQAIAIIKKTEVEAKALEAKLLAETKSKEAAELANLAVLLKTKEEESRRRVSEE